MKTYTSVDQGVHTLIVRQDGNGAWIGMTQESPWISSRAPTKNELLRTVGNVLRKALKHERRSHQGYDEIKEIVWRDKENLFQEKIGLHVACSDPWGMKDFTFGYFIQEDGSLKDRHRTQPKLVTTWEDISTLYYGSSLNQENFSYQKSGITWDGIKRRSSDDYLPRLAPGQDGALSGIAFEAHPESAYVPVPIQGEDDSLKLLYQSQLAATCGDVKKGLSIDRLFILGPGQPYVPSSEIPAATIGSPLDTISIPSPKSIPPKTNGKVVGKRIFIGHGGSDCWEKLRGFIEKDIGLPHDEFNRVSTAGLTITERLQQMTDQADMAFLIMTAENQYADGTWHARENVVHEIGLFQGVLGFKKAIILLEEGCGEFSNICGLIQIRFSKGKIEEAFEEIRQVLEREGILL